MKSKKRADGPASPVGVYGVSSSGPAGPVCPEWLKYGPIERITGVLAFAGRLAGRRTSACSLVPSASVMYACVHLDPGGGASARAVAGSARTAAMAISGAVRMETPTQRGPVACGELMARLGLGLAALGRPGYLNVGHGAELGDDRSVDALRARSHEVLDFAYAQGIRDFDA